jgi:hypothetical protein
MVEGGVRHFLGRFREFHRSCASGVRAPGIKGVDVKAKVSRGYVGIRVGCIRIGPLTRSRMSHHLVRILHRPSKISIISAEHFLLQSQTDSRKMGLAGGVVGIVVGNVGGSVNKLKVLEYGLSETRQGCHHGEGVSQSLCQSGTRCARWRRGTHRQPRRTR